MKHGKPHPFVPWQAANRRGDALRATFGTRLLKPGDLRKIKGYLQDVDARLWSWTKVCMDQEAKHT